MSLKHYLDEHFFSKDQLLQLTQTPNDTFEHFQQVGIFPKPSYRISSHMTCHSFFGEHSESETIDYYAKGYASWMGFLQVQSEKKQVFEVFSHRYRSELKRLQQQGMTSTASQFNQTLSKHIDQEWLHFIDGTYGLCTRSGLPEEIAAKALAISGIEGFISQPQVTDSERKTLERLVNLLDHVSAPFAPHERERSSRERLIHQVRKRYSLEG